jgi:diaminopimelate decarboxylase
MDDPMISAMECKQLLKDEATAFVLYSIDDVRKTLTQLEKKNQSRRISTCLASICRGF